MHKLCPTNVGFVNTHGCKLSDFGDRLREERTRLKLNQIEFGELGGVSKNAQLSYEKAERRPDADYLMRLVPHGVDVHYLLTGVHAGHAQSPLPVTHSEALLLLGSLTEERLRAVLVVLEGLAEASR
jgi:transcriptional regulator with XRE-family HTH domain